jgi:flavorubredoxin
LAGVKSSAATHTTGYGVIVIGGPVYAGSLTNSVKDALKSLVLSHDHGNKIGVFGSGQGVTSPDDIAQIKQSIPTSSDDTLSNAVVAKIGSNEDLDTRVQDFVNQLLT